MTKPTSITYALLASALVFVSLQAQADPITLTTADAVYNSETWDTDNCTSNNQNDIIACLVEHIDLNSDDLKYKSNTEGGEEESGFDLDGNYTTTFSNSLSDPANASIVWDGGDFISGDPIYLLVKDGNNTPAWYLLDLTSIWDGQETLNLFCFWGMDNGDGTCTSEGQGAMGAISNVSLYGGMTTVPEPGTLALFGAALLGFGAARRRKV